MSIDTKNVRRRSLSFRTLDDALVEARKLAEADAAGRVVASGNWTLGQALGHIAAWCDFAFDGYPPAMKAPPWFLRPLFRLMKKKFLRGLPQGYRMPKVSGGTYGVEVLPTAEGLARMERAFARLKHRAPSAPNLVFGPMTHEEWIALQSRHAELHLGFFSTR